MFMGLKDCPQLVAVAGRSCDSLVKVLKVMQGVAGRSPSNVRHGDSL